MGERTDQLDDLGYDPTSPGDEIITEETIVARTDAMPVDSYPMGTAGTFGAASPDAYGGGSYDMADDTDSGGSDSVEATRQQIEQTRSQMSQTIDAIQDKLSPSNMVQQAKDTVRDATIGKAQDAVSSAGDTAAGFGSGIIETIKQNPIPAALAGAGIGWLIMSGRNSTPKRSGYYPSSGYGRTYTGYTSDRGYAGSSYGQGYGSDYGPGYGTYQSGNGNQDSAGGTFQQAGAAAGNVAGQVQDTAGQVVGQVQDTAGQVVDQVQNTAGEAVNQVQDTAGQLVNQAQYGVQQASNGLQQMMEENPLAVVAGSLALGIAVGLAIPETPKENELMGPARDALVDQAQGTVQHKAQQVQAVAQQAAGAAKDAAQQAAQQAAGEQGLTS